MIPFVAKKAKTSEAAGTATWSQRGWRSRRSIPTRIVPSRHEQADLLDARLGPRRLAHDLALVHDDDPIRERQDLVEVLADQQDTEARSRCLVEVRVDALDRADVEPARRRGRHEHLRPARKFPREHD